MIRKDREISDRETIIGIIKKCHVCHLAVNDHDSGFPYIVPMNFGIIESDNKIYLTFHCAKRGKKLELIAKDPRATFEMECDVKLVYNPKHGHNTDVFKSVIGHGILDFVYEPEKKALCLKALVDRYHKTQIAIKPEDIGRCTILRLEITDFVGKEKSLANNADYR